MQRALRQAATTTCGTQCNLWLGVAALSFAGLCVVYFDRAAVELRRFPSREGRPPQEQAFPTRFLAVEATDFPHYGDPAAGCGESDIDIGYAKYQVCAPRCNPTTGAICPLNDVDLQDGRDLSLPQCMPLKMSGKMEWICALKCTTSDQCTSPAVCVSDLAMCMYQAPAPPTPIETCIHRVTCPHGGVLCCNEPAVCCLDQNPWRRPKYKQWACGKGGQCIKQGR